jgi:predicted secreted protein
MTVVQGIVTFAIIWWLVLFMALPWGVRRQENPVPGTEPGAPERPRLLIKFAVTTVLAILLTATVAWIIDSGLVHLGTAPTPLG